MDIRSIIDMYFVESRITSLKFFPHLISGALDSREAANNIDPLVDLSDHTATSNFHRGPQVHDLIGYVKLVTHNLK